MAVDTLGAEPWDADQDDLDAGAGLALQVMIRSLGVYPPGSVVKLSNDALALVYALSSPSTLNGETDFSILALIKGTAS